MVVLFELLGMYVRLAAYWVTSMGPLWRHKSGGLFSSWECVQDI